uniref:Uncharacterized protein n=1 Tax=Chromera velia CCMP2878 TaxID=1169474 RepID=A0A0G4HEP2_9ALVE|eukprot:Cvel_6582.t1-p1 / transcript=Cvel_6582.t1 / gene=Cvel_6582 / organism=Chromera_velia_CCMP2878 / gene_product=Ankyrin-3, putative / transcript_product=Ankyrin-3, putative / location=Cvel_scaffold324:92541-93947(+) / protein_length=469 / sequence_SO=supercontig / SO=protein_coding / is_pseudo=false
MEFARSKAALVPVEQELERLEEVLLGVVESCRAKRKVLAQLKFPPMVDGQDQGLSSPPQTPFPPEAAVLARLRSSIESVAADLKKVYRSGVDEIVSLNFHIDLSPLFSSSIGSVIRSFQSANAATLHTALDVYFSTGQREDLDLLLKVGADVNGSVQGCTVLHKAVGLPAGTPELVHLLLDAGARPDDCTAVFVEGGSTALHLACKKRRPQIARDLVVRGANVNAETLVDKSRSLHLAAQNGDSALVDFLIARGAEIHAKKAVQVADDDGETALHTAIRFGHRGTVELLLDRGANVMERAAAAGSGARGPTALHYTARSFRLPDGTFTVTDHRDIADVLISRGADVDATENTPVVGHQSTPLLLAAHFGCPAVAELLIDRGANVHATDSNGYTALHHAAVRVRGSTPLRKLRVAQMLVARGIDVNAVNHFEQTARAIAANDTIGTPADCPLRTFFEGLLPAEGGGPTGG